MQFQPQIDIDSLISKGARPLPLKEPTDTRIWVEDTNSWLERISGIKGATNCVYFYEPGHQEPHESEFLIYDRDSQTLYYRLMIDFIFQILNISYQILMPKEY